MDPSEHVFRTKSGKAYSTGAYRREIHRAARRAHVAEWGPNQIRHLIATEVKQRFGRSHEEAFVGHTAEVAESVYIERDLPLAITVAVEIG